MARIPDAARPILEGPNLAHVVTINPDGSPQVSCVWVGLRDDEVVFASLGPWRKLRNLERDPRISLSVESPTVNAMGMREYLVIQGKAIVEAGGAPELLQELAHVYVGPDVKFPPMDDPPPGTVVRITADRVSGMGPWSG
jgi:PPOX class probable F420-dependent enzyme